MLNKDSILRKKGGSKTAALLILITCRLIYTTP
jgi:hypothetical protein